MHTVLAAVLAAALLQTSGGAARREGRHRMVQEQIEARGVKNPSVLFALRQAPRHLFVPPERREHAYADRPLPIGKGQTISQPYIVALMSELLEPAKGHRVLEIGTGSGYQAAILSLLVREVYSIEIVPELAASARERLAALHYANVRVRQGDGYLGWPEAAPFDGVLLTAAPPEIPEALIAQLKPGGRLVAPVGEGREQTLIVLTKNTRGETARRAVIPVIFVPMVHPN